MVVALFLVRPRGPAVPTLLQSRCASFQRCSLRATAAVLSQQLRLMSRDAWSGPMHGGQHSRATVRQPHISTLEQ